jgi:hypothetical protein
LFYVKQLAFMRRRLKTNQVAFEAHIAAMERALKEGAEESSEVKLLVRQLEGGKKHALEELEQFEIEWEDERRKRDRDRGQLEAHAATAARMGEWRSKKEQMVTDLEVWN